MKYLFILPLFLVLLQPATAQIDLQCSGRDQHSLYVVISDSGFFRIDSVDTHPTNPILLATDTMNTVGISINKNLDSVAGNNTMYIVADTFLNYFYLSNGRWRNSHHSRGSYGAVNPGGSDNYIFNLATGKIFRYDGTGNATLLMSGVDINGLLWDIATDKNGNFYLFYTLYNKIVAYSPQGIPIDSFTTTGAASGGAGFAILGSRMYIIQDSPEALYEGIITGHTVNFSIVKTFPGHIVFSDMAACPDAGEPLAVFKNPAAPHFIIYPNPAIDYATINLDNTATIEVTDCMGRKIFSAPVRGLTQYELQLAGYAPGVYFVKATSTTGITTLATLAVK